MQRLATNLVRKSNITTSTTQQLKYFSTVSHKFNQQQQGEDQWVFIGDPLKKKIIKQGGATSESPKNGNFVRVHYVGTLASNGQKFDSSRDRNEPFQFRLGAGEVIPGWDLGVASMKKGEVCLLSVPAMYGYGTRGIPGVIPGNATLHFEIELLDWK